VTPEWASMAGAFERRVVRWATSQLGAPYLWGGKGGVRHDVQAGLRPWKSDEMEKAKAGYDCSGLVTCALREVTGVDVRATWNAQALYSATAEYAGIRPLYRTLRFYGASRTRVVHVAIGEESRGPLVLTTMLLEAAGAGSDATTERIALGIPGARVRLMDDSRQDFVSSVPLWALAVAAGALVAPPVAP